MSAESLDTTFRNGIQDHCIKVIGAGLERQYER